jgi:hypothetical protein
MEIVSAAKDNQIEAKPIRGWQTARRFAQAGVLEFIGKRKEGNDYEADLFYNILCHHLHGQRGLRDVHAGVSQQC